MSKLVTYEELKAHTTKEDIYLLISGKGTLSANQTLLFCVLNLRAVYDVTKFIDEVRTGFQVSLVLRVNAYLAPRRRRSHTR